MEQIKIAFIGQSATGKTSVIMRIVNDQFVSERQATLNIAQLNKIIEVDGIQYNVSMWDTAGQERFDAIVPTYYRSCNAVVIVMSVDQQDSFTKAKYWLNQVLSNADSDILIFGVLNKADLVGEEVALSYDMVHAFGAANKVKTQKLSAKTGLNVQSFFDSMIHDILAVRMNSTKKLDVDMERKGCCK